MRHILIVIFILSFTLLNCRAEVSGSFSVEWLTCASDVVAVGKITVIKNSKGPGQVIYADCILTVSEIIKGPPAETIPFCYRYLAKSYTWMAPQDEVLVCLTRYKTPYDEAQIHLYTDPYYEARLHNLLMPTSEHNPFSVISLSAPDRYVFSGQLKQLTTRDSILQAARSASAAFASRRGADRTFQLKPRQIWLEMGSDAWQILYRGSGCFIQVPAFMFPETK